MRLLFVHQNFPGQYRHLARHYGAQRGNQVVAIGERVNIQRQRPHFPGVKVLGYQMPKVEGDNLNKAIARGRVLAAGTQKLRASGFKPDVIFTHLGWGEAIFLKDIFPDALVVLYCEFFYHSRGADSGFDPEFPPSAKSLKTTCSRACSTCTRSRGTS